MPQPKVEELQSKIIQLVCNAQQLGTVSMTPRATALCVEKYPELSCERFGLVGAVCDRSAPQVIRIALIYCLLDGATAIDVMQLRLALAVWNFCEESAKTIFKGRGSSNIEDRVFAALHEGEKTATEISQYLQRNVASADIKAAVNTLMKAGFITSFREKRGAKTVSVFCITSTKNTNFTKTAEGLDREIVCIVRQSCVKMGEGTMISPTVKEYE